MKDYEFISYVQYPEDQYVNASCKVRICSRFVVVFLEKKVAKTGGTFWDTMSAGVTHEGEKKYPKAFRDPLVEDEELKDWIRSNVKRVTASPNVQMSGSIQSGVAENEAIPF